MVVGDALNMDNENKNRTKPTKTKKKLNNQFYGKLTEKTLSKLILSKQFSFSNI